MNKAELEAAISTLDTFIQIFAVLVAIGILGEVGFGVRHWVLSRRLAVIQHAEDLNQEQAIAGMNKEAGDARRDASLAMERAGKAEENLGNARKDAALALQRAADANRIAEEERLKRVQIEERMKPRSLKPAAQAISVLKAYQGTEYTFSSVFGDEESITLLKQLDSILLSVGWTRVKPPHAYPAINVYGQEQDFAVASGLRSGIKVYVDSETPLVTLQASPIDKLPAPARAAVVLAMELTASLAPPQDDGVKANVERGKSMTVRIEIGRKP